MFTIQLKHPLKAYSHQTTTLALIPNTYLSARICPGWIHIEDLISSISYDIQLHIQGPITQFTVEQECEKGKMKVFMHTAKGYVRYTLFQRQTKLFLKVEKAPLSGLRITYQGIDQTYKKDKELLIEKNLKESSSPKQFARLFLGSLKAEDIALIWRRQDIKEMLPFLFALSQGLSFHAFEKEGLGGNYELVQTLEKAIYGAQKMRLEQNFLNLINCAFESLWTPRSNDTQYQGLTSTQSEDSPIYLLAKMKKLISALFVREYQETLDLLPQLPLSLTAGKLINYETKWGLLSLEWSKKQLKRVQLIAKKEGKITLILPSKLKSYRLTSTAKWLKGERKHEQTLHLSKNVVYYLDRFEK